MLPLRCFGRIRLNGLIQPFQQPERGVGFLNTHRQLYPASRNVRRAIAELFQQWSKGWSEERTVPVVEAPTGRRDEFVDPYFKRAKPDQVVVILKAREPGAHRDRCRRQAGKPLAPSDRRSMDRPVQLLDQ
jgi:hypothetical protein